MPAGHSRPPAPPAPVAAAVTPASPTAPASPAAPATPAAPSTPAAHAAPAPPPTPPPPTPPPERVALTKLQPDDLLRFVQQSSDVSPWRQRFVLSALGSRARSAGSSPACARSAERDRESVPLWGAEG